MEIVRAGTLIRIAETIAKATMAPDWRSAWVLDYSLSPPLQLRNTMTATTTATTTAHMAMVAGIIMARVNMDLVTVAVTAPTVGAGSTTILAENMAAIVMAVTADGSRRQQSSGSGLNRSRFFVRS